MNRMFAVALILTPLTLLAITPETPISVSPSMVTSVGGCAGVKSIADVVVRKLLAECIAENPELGDVELQKLCQFGDEVWPVVRDLISAQKKGMAKAAAARSMKDAGRD